MDATSEGNNDDQAGSDDLERVQHSRRISMGDDHEM